MHVFSNKGLGDISGKVAILFFLHGRQGSASELNKKAESVVRLVGEKGRAPVELLVVTLVRITLLCLRDAG